MPLTWDELPEAEPDRFDLRTVRGLLAERGDPHAEMPGEPKRVQPSRARKDPS
jgi:DNA primase